MHGREANLYIIDPLLLGFGNFIGLGDLGLEHIDTILIAAKLMTPVI